VDLDASKNCGLHTIVMDANQLSRAADVIDALGGVKAVAELTQTTYRAAHNWKARGQFPAKTYALMIAELRARDCDADSSLWGQA
jgi:hypothetical protein